MVDMGDNLKASMGDVESLKRLGFSYLSGDDSKKKGSAGKAFRYLKQAADRGDADCCYQVAKCYQEGIGTEADGEACMVWMTRAAEQGHSSASYYIGEAFLPMLASDGCSLRYLDYISMPDGARAFKEISGHLPEAMGAEFDVSILIAYKYYRVAAEEESALSRYAAGFCSLALFFNRPPDVLNHGVRISSLPNQAKSWLEYAACEGMPEAKYMLYWLVERNAVCGNKELARQWLEDAVEAGIVPAKRELALRLMAEQAPDEYIEMLLQDAADNGDTAASCLLGHRLFMKRRYREAYQNLIKGDEYAVAQRDLAESLFYGWHGKSDWNDAYRYLTLLENTPKIDGDAFVDRYIGAIDINQEAPAVHNAGLARLQRAIEAGDVGAAHELGKYYRDVEGDNAKAIDAFKSVDWKSNAVLLGDVGFAMLSMAFEADAGCEEDGGASDLFQSAYSVLEEAAELGNVDAQVEIGDAYHYGEHHVRDYTQARYWYKMGSESNSSAQFNLGLLALDEGCYSDAVFWFTRAHESGLAEATRFLADCYALGNGVEQNYETAATLYEAASSDGDIEAMALYGECLLYGWGVSQDADRAATYLRRSAQAGSTWALHLLGDMYIEGEGVEKDIGKGVRYYLKGYELGDEYCGFKYGKCLFDGIGFDCDKEKGRELIYQAAEQGWKDAQEWVAANTESSVDELNNLVGLSEVKASIAQLERTVLYNNARRDLGYPVNDASFHMLFLGNPGTGKTTVARILAKRLFDLGVLQSSTLVEVDRSSLVGTHYGEGLEKLAQIVDEADGGILFVDEAYGLKTDERDALGQEVVDALVKVMEDKRDSMMVIMAGYEREMAQFLKANSGLESRFQYTFHFEDYSLQELMEIYGNMMAANNNIIDADALEKVSELLDVARNMPGFGNARFVRKLYQSIEAVHMNKTFDPLRPETINHFVKEDIPDIEAIH